MKDIDFTSSGEKITIGPEAKEAVMKKLESDVLVNDAEYMWTSCVYALLTVCLVYSVHTVVAQVNTYGHFTITAQFSVYTMK